LTSPSFSKLKVNPNHEQHQMDGERGAESSATLAANDPMIHRRQLRACVVFPSLPTVHDSIPNRRAQIVPD
jgi:hypothetical protein